MSRGPATFSPDVLVAWVHDARERTLALVRDLSDDAMLGPALSIVNPPMWEIGHVAWFQERWVLRHAYHAPAVRGDSDRLYDSGAIAHDTRWNLPLPSRGETIAYLNAVRDAVVERLRKCQPTAEEAYFVLLTIFHEDMHGEAFTYTRQTFGYPAPSLPGATPALSQDAGRGALEGDVDFPGGVFALGANSDEPFVFDNEKWAHPVELPAFSIARAPVTQSEFAEFVENGGYRRTELWSVAGWQWRTQHRADQPIYWRQATGGGWERRDFDRWVALEPNRPMLHVNWYEADAYCRWAGRRLATEAEWEEAASVEGDLEGRPLTNKRRFPWGAEAPTAARANLDSLRLGCVDVAALPAGDSACGCRGMIGNVWEWTADDFLPYPGFVADPYKEYSQPWFGSHKVLRGGCWATQGRLLRNTWRNFYTPDRRDVWAGFRTCALQRQGD